MAHIHTYMRIIIICFAYAKAGTTTRNHPFPPVTTRTLTFAPFSWHSELMNAHHTPTALEDTAQRIHTALQLIRAGEKLAVAAKVAGVSTSTIWRYTRATGITLPTARQQTPRPRPEAPPAAPRPRGPPRGAHKLSGADYQQQWRQLGEDARQGLRA